MTPDPAESTLLHLFREEAEAQVEVLTNAILALEREPSSAEHLDACMRAAHSVKGAARMVGVEPAVRISHAMEDCFVASQQGRTTLAGRHIDVLIEATDLLLRIAHTSPEDIGTWSDVKRSTIDRCLATLAGSTGDSHAAADEPTSTVDPPAPVPVAPSPKRRDDGGADPADRALRVTAESLNQLIALAGESLVESRWVKPFAQSLVRVKRVHKETGRLLDRLRDRIADEDLHSLVADAESLLIEGQQLLAQRLADLEMFDHRSTSLAHRIYDEALACRMRPFADGTRAYPRLVRDTARALGKRAHLEIVGETTQVDRDILVSLDAPLGHLLRNAVDHGLESPEERVTQGKSPEGSIRLEASHRAGALHITVSDDGQGVDLERLRQAVVERRLVHSEDASALSEAELLEFLFLPGFSMKSAVTDLSGRGVGLDVVREMASRVRGVVRISSTRGAGTRFHLQLPVTLSVVRTLLAEIGGEPYAFPLASVARMAYVRRDAVESLEGRQHFALDGQRVALVSAHHVLDTPRPTAAGTGDIPVVVIGDRARLYGLGVDRFLGERELVVQPLDPALGKVRDIAAGALMPDGSPVLIVDTEDLVRSIDKIASERRLEATASDNAAVAVVRKRVLVVDDSLTVREVERKLLTGAGYEVEVAVDGMDGWNAVRSGRFDLVVTDVDMPRMDGFELVGLIARDSALRSTPVVIVSYKDRDEDRRRGLEAGAARYLTKGSFHDDTLVGTVADLIGGAHE